MSVPSRTFTKDPDEVQDYGFDWNGDADDGGPWLEDGDTVSTSTWIVPSGITKDSDSKSTTVTKIWLSGGTDGEEYLIANRMVSAEGRTVERSFVVQVRAR